MNYKEKPQIISEVEKWCDENNISFDMRMSILKLYYYDLGNQYLKDLKYICKL